MAWRIPHWQAVASKSRMIIGHERRRAIPGVYDDGGTVNTRCLKEAIGDAPIHVERRGESLVSADRDRYFLAQQVVSLVVQGSERLFKKHDLLPRSLSMFGDMPESPRLAYRSMVLTCLPPKSS